MLPSDILRREISKKYNINLEQYVWTEEFKKKIFEINLDKNLEESADNLKDIFQQGFNIGHCGLTSRYIAIQFETAKLYYGEAKLLKGTINSPNGEHAWTTINNYLIDTTLMINIPLSQIQELGYIPKKEIAYDSAKVLSEYDTYEQEFSNKNSKQK